MAGAGIAVVGMTLIPLKSQGIKQLMAGAGIAVVGMTLIPLLSGLFG